MKQGAPLSQMYKDTTLWIYTYWRKQKDQGDRMPVAPGVREIMVGVGLNSTASTNYRLNRLRSLGLLQDANMHHRGIRLTDEGFELAEGIYEENLKQKQS